MGQEKIYDIFISYRRDGGGATAGRINDLLTADGYSVSYDVDTLREGQFDSQLLERIEQCQDFILVVDKNCFVRAIDPATDPQEDWLWQELSYAMKLKKTLYLFCWPVLVSLNNCQMTSTRFVIFRHQLVCMNILIRSTAN